MNSARRHIGRQGRRGLIVENATERHDTSIPWWAASWDLWTSKELDVEDGVGDDENDDGNGNRNGCWEEGGKRKSP